MIQDNEPNSFNLIFKSVPKLSEQVEHLYWDSSAKILKLILKETSEFHVYRWVNEIKKYCAEIKKSPFHHMEKDTLTLQFLSDNNVLIKIQFTDLKIEQHCCNLKANFKNPLKYKVVVSYGSESLC
jgi:hypothetical protein